jgi:hypothetical protein
MPFLSFDKGGNYDYLHKQRHLHLFICDAHQQAAMLRIEISTLTSEQHKGLEGISAGGPWKNCPPCSCDQAASL